MNREKRTRKRPLVADQVREPGSGEHIGEVGLDSI